MLSCQCVYGRWICFSSTRDHAENRSSSEFARSFVRDTIPNGNMTSLQREVFRFPERNTSKLGWNVLACFNNTCKPFWSWRVPSTTNLFRFPIQEDTTIPNGNMTSLQLIPREKRFKTRWNVLACFDNTGKPFLFRLGSLSPDRFSSRTQD